MKILIADDHAVVRMGIVSLLREEIMGLQWRECGSSEEALNLAMEEKFDLVIADVTMPGRSGLDLLRDLRSCRPNLPVLVVSALAEKEYAVRAFKLGAAGFISKESATEVLISAVRRVLAGGRYVSPALAEDLAGQLGGPAIDAPQAALSNRELEVLKLVAAGHSLKSIASKLALSEKTIATYRARISSKLGLATNVDLTRFALKQGLID
ncbi:response regulator transcription factor [Haloferula sargassicola]|uniref:Response regulator GacA n=1 Tax=Haloferula sargassicola TaxID=490096 RepID=A0ABP9UI59_9BACT